MLPVPLGEVHIVLPVGVAAVLLIGDGVVLRAGEAQLRHLAEGGNLPANIKKRRHEALLAAKLDRPALPAGGDADGAHRVIQAVLPQIVHIFDDKGGAEGREGFQK